MTFEITDAEHGEKRVAWATGHTMAMVVRALCAEVYAHSKALGMGAMHFVDGPLSEEWSDKIWAFWQDHDEIRMDYVLGRCCKFFAVPGEDGSLVVDYTTYIRDHSEEDWLNIFSATERRLEGEPDAVSETGLLDLLTQAVLPLADHDESRTKHGAKVTVITLGAPDLAFGDEAVEVFDGKLVRSGSYLVNVAALADVDGDELALLASRGVPQAEAAIAALKQAKDDGGDADEITG